MVVAGAASRAQAAIAAGVVRIGCLRSLAGGGLGGFKWSSQHLDQGGCGGPSKAAFGSVPARRVAVPGPPLRGAAGGSAPVLGVDRGGARGGGRRRRRRRGGGSGGTVGPGGGGAAPRPTPRGV